MKRVDLNADIGEGFPHDEALLDVVTSANIGCGVHSGSVELTRKTIDLCKELGVRIGCHPGFPDRATMGRAIPGEELIQPYVSSLIEQVERFWNEGPASYIKPHGAWYNVLCSQPEGTGAIFSSCFQAVVRMASRFGVPTMLMPEAPASSGLKTLGLTVISEGFADRAYGAEGKLVSRTEAGAILTDLNQIKHQVIELAMSVDSICVHGDTPGCVQMAMLVRKTLEDAGYGVGYPTPDR